METRSEELSKRLVEQTGQSKEQADKEVSLSIQRLFHWAAYCDKYGGNVQVRK